MEKDAFCSSGIRNQVFLEDGNFMAVYDLRPMLPGHTLLIPKRHVMQVSELTKDELASFSWMLKKVIPVLLKTYGADSYNLAVNYGKNEECPSVTRISTSCRGARVTSSTATC